MQRLTRIVSLIVISLIFTACNPIPVKIATIPLPPSVNEEALEGAYEVPVDNANFAIIQALKDAGYSVPSEYRYGIVRDGTSRDTILAFYKSSLDSSWQSDQRITYTSVQNYAYAGWRRGRQALIVNYVEWQPDFNIVVMMLTEN
jgi:hypothetical protein